MFQKIFSAQFISRRIATQTLILLFIIILSALTACGGSAAPTPETITARQGASERVVVVETVALQKEAEVVKQVQASPPDESAPADDAQAQPTPRAPRSGPTSNRLIIKNAELEMMVEDTDTAINRSLGIVIEYDAYVISNRTWFKDGFKYATLSIGVPVKNFEQMMRRLKDLAVVVSNETASGQDVSDQYVDLESRLRNLEATASRIRDFLSQAKDVDKALEVSDRLSEVEAEIEQVKGQMAYIKDRAAFSTITLQIAPQIPTPTPMPTPTPTMTPSPTPSPTPTPAWDPADTFNKASTVATTSARSLFQVAVDLLIWFVLVALPCLLPLFLLAWGASKLYRRYGGGA